MKKSGRLVTGLLGLAMAAVTILPAVASKTYTHTIDIPRGQAWTKVYGAERDGNNKDVLVRCNTVYPIEGVDYFRKIQCRVVAGYGSDEPITEEGVETLEEGKPYTSMELLNGYVGLYSVCFQFRGNSYEAAYANVSYTGN